MRFGFYDYFHVKFLHFIFTAMQSFHQNIPALSSSLLTRFVHRQNCRLLSEISAEVPKFRPLNAIEPDSLQQAQAHLRSLLVPLLPGEAQLKRMHLKPYVRVKNKRKPLFDGQPLCKGVVLRTLVKKPRKPNSANRKCVLLRLSTGKEMVAYVPGEGHNLQEHNVVLCRIARLRDTPGVKIKCIRGAYDLPHVTKKKI